MSEIEFRTATAVAVDYRKRMIEVIVMPYESEAVVEHKGRMIREICSRGAYDGIEKRPNRVVANRDHDMTRLAGRALKFHPSRAEGLVAEVRAAQTVLGEETLGLAAEGILDASAGFVIMDGGEEWQGRDLRRLTRVWLDHIAFTPDPAYAEAKVLAVRAASEPVEPVSATPNLDEVRAWLREDGWAKAGQNHTVVVS